jgi:hypothetical protein
VPDCPAKTSQWAVIGNPDYTLRNMVNAQSPEFFPFTFLNLFQRFDAVEPQDSEQHLFFVISAIRDRLG